MGDIVPAAVGERVNAASELPRDLFIGCPASGHKDYVEAREASNRDEEQACNTHYSQCDDGVQAVDVLPVVEDEEEAEAKHGHDVSRQRQEEEEEVAVVSPADAVVHPRTVVVKVLDTVVADGAVGAARRPVEATGRTPLHPDLDPSDLHRLVERSTEVILLVFVLLSSREDAGVHERGHAEVSQNKEEDDSIVDGHSDGETLREPRTREAEEERGGADQEESGRRHGDVAGRSQRSARWDDGVRQR